MRITIELNGSRANTFLIITLHTQSSIDVTAFIASLCPIKTHPLEAQSHAKIYMKREAKMGRAAFYIPKLRSAWIRLCVRFFYYILQVDSYGDPLSARAVLNVYAK